MGVTLSHDAYDGSYSGFDGLREFLFALAGYGDLSAVDDYLPTEEDDGSPVEVPDNAPRLKDVMPKSEPLYPLFTQDDTEGRIRNAALPPLARRLRRLVVEHPDETAEIYGGIASPEGIAIFQPEAGRPWKDLVLRLAEGCERAHDASEDLVWDWPLAHDARVVPGWKRGRHHVVRMTVLLREDAGAVETPEDAAFAALDLLADADAGAVERHGGWVSDVDVRLAGRHERHRMPTRVR